MENPKKYGWLMVVTLVVLMISFNVVEKLQLGCFLSSFLFIAIGAVCIVLLLFFDKRKKAALGKEKQG